MIKKYKKIILIIIFLVTLFSMQSSFTYASTMGDILSGAENFVSQGQSNTPISGDSIKTLSDSIYNILLIIGIVIAVIVGIIIGIQFITGSVEQKSKVKESLIPYFVGCAVIFGAFGIWKLAVILLGSLN